jgi:hypothetical protein
LGYDILFTSLMQRLVAVVRHPQNAATLAAAKTA